MGHGVRPIRALAVVWATFLIAPLVVLVPEAAADTVTIADGDADGLRAAIKAANTNGLDDTINLAPRGHYVLTKVVDTLDGPNGLPSILPDRIHALTINGNGATITRGATGTPALRLIHVAV